MQNLPPMNIRYPFDPTGRSPDNLVRDELRSLPLIRKRILVPTMGAFYTESLRIRNLERELVKGKDYELVMLYHDATVETGKDVNIGIYFSNLDIIGEVYLTYQVVGGKFTGVWEAVQQYVNVLLVDPRQVRWDDVLNKPDFYVPKEHFHDINDVYGLNALIPFLEEIRDAIMRIRSKELRRVYELIYNLENNVQEQLDGADGKVANTLDKLLKENDDLRLLKEKVRDLLSRLEALENNTDLTDEIAKLKEFDRLINNKAASLDENKADKTDLAETNRNVNQLMESKADKSILDNTVSEVNKIKESKLDKSELRPVIDDVEELKRNPGMTCESIGRLPQKPWTRGTSILAKGPDGACFRMVPPESLFQDVGVKITADKTVIVRERDDTSQYYTVKYIVTNSGLNTNDKTQLTITLPNQSDKTPYSISPIEHSFRGADRIVTISENIYEIYGLRSGATATFIFRLTPEGFGSYQLGAQVDVFSEYDTNTQNNTSSIILSSSLPVSTIDENYIPSIDCPRIIGHDLVGNKPLKPLLTTLINNNNVIKSYITDFNFSQLLPNSHTSTEPKRLSVNSVSDQYKFLINNFNFISSGEDGKIKIKLQNASSVIVTKYGAGSKNNDNNHHVGVYRPINSDKYYIINRSASNINDNNYYYDILTGMMPPFKSRSSYKVINESGTYTVDGAYVGFDTKLDNKTFSDYDFNISTSILTINTDNGLFCISCRPNGNNCNWQSFIINANVNKLPEIIYKYRISPEGLENRYYTISSTEENSLNPVDLLDVNGEVIAHVYYGYKAVKYIRSDRGNYYNDYVNSNTKSVTENIVINIPRGTAKSFKLYMIKPGTIPVIKGNINITNRQLDKRTDSSFYNNPNYSSLYIRPEDSREQWSIYEVNVNIKSTATSTDNFSNEYIKINIV